MGKKPPLTPDEVSLIRMILRQEKALRDQAVFNIALDTSFRGSDLVRLRVADVTTPVGVREIVEIRQKKTETRNARPVQARLSFGDARQPTRLDPSLYGLHSLRRTFPTHIYQQTGNLRAAQLLLGHASIESTKEYIGTEQAEALEIARKYYL